MNNNQLIYKEFLALNDTDKYYEWLEYSFKQYYLEDKGNKKAFSPLSHLLREGEVYGMLRSCFHDMTDETKRKFADAVLQLIQYIPTAKENLNAQIVLFQLVEKEKFTTCIRPVTAKLLFKNHGRYQDAEHNLFYVGINAIVSFVGTNRKTNEIVEESLIRIYSGHNFDKELSYAAPKILYALTIIDEYLSPNDAGQFKNHFNRLIHIIDGIYKNMDASGVKIYMFLCDLLDHSNSIKQRHVYSYINSSNELYSSKSIEADKVLFLENKQLNKKSHDTAFAFIENMGMG